MLKDKEFRKFLKLERVYDIGLVRRNNFSKEQYENNKFEIYFSESVVKNIEALLLRDEIEEEMALNPPEQPEDEEVPQTREEQLA